MCMCVSLNRFLYRGKWILKYNAKKRCFGIWFFIIEECLKIVEWNVGLDTGNDINEDVKNKWVWDWLLEKCGFFVRLYKKKSQPGVAICLSHKETLHYGSSDKKKIKFTAL